jgi:hypothetical protein
MKVSHGKGAESLRPHLFMHVLKSYFIGTEGISEISPKTTDRYQAPFLSSSGMFRISKFYTAIIFGE